MASWESSFLFQGREQLGPSRTVNAILRVTIYIHDAPVTLTYLNSYYESIKNNMNDAYKKAIDVYTKAAERREVSIKSLIAAENEDKSSRQELSSAKEELRKQEQELQDSMTLPGRVARAQEAVKIGVKEVA